MNKLTFGKKTFDLDQFKSYQITGILTNGKRFKPIQYSDVQWAMGINLYNGSIWGIKSDNKRVLLKRI